MPKPRKFSGVLLLVLASVLAGQPAKAQFWVYCARLAGGEAGLPDIKDIPFRDWVRVAPVRALALLARNIHPPGTAAGIIVAALQKENPDYFRMWDRDGALVIGVEITEYDEATGDLVTQVHYLRDIQDYIALLHRIKNDETQASRELGWPYKEGEAVRGPDGKPIKEKWGVPQNDGPGQVSIALGSFGLILLKQGKRDLLLSLNLYSSNPNDGALITNKANYILYHFREFSFGPWEEEYGLHTNVMMVQRKGLVMAAALARRLGDAENAKKYVDAAIALEGMLRPMFKEDKGYIIATTGVPDGKGMGKYSNLDINTLLGSLHGDLNDPLLEPDDLLGLDATLFAPSSDYVLSTTYHLLQAFRGHYDFNKKGTHKGTLMGRYIEDKWAGARGMEGYAWFLATLAVGEIDFRAANEFQQKGEIPVTRWNIDFLNDSLRIAAGVVPEISLEVGQTIGSPDPRFESLLTAIRVAGDEQLRLVQSRADSDGSMAEGIDPRTGAPAGPKSLAWNYEAVVRTIKARDRLFPDGGWINPIDVKGSPVQ